jgi:serine/threonine protein kinase
MGVIIDGRWLVDEILGMGGAGITYSCIDQATGEQVALKYLHADRRSGVLAHRLAIEGEVLELLNHPHIVPFRCLKVGGVGACYLATAYQAGGSLEGWIRRDGALSPGAVLAVGRQLALALEYVHAGGIVHRDLKPGNVLLENDDPEAPIVRLADFGIARVFRSARVQAGITRTGAFIGTPEYAAPEQIRGEKGVGPAADAFALGALLHFCASGKQLLSRRAIQDWEAFRAREWDPSDRPRLTSLADTADDVGFLALLDRVIDSLMSASPAQRLGLADAALALGAIHDELSPENRPAFHPPTLVSIQEGWSDLDEPEFVAALVPEDDEPETVKVEVPNLADTATVPIPDDAAYALPWVERSASWLSPASDGHGTDDVEWPPRSVRRRRRMARSALVAALVVAALLAWPGGLAALMGPHRVAALPTPLRGLVASLSPAPAVDLDALEELDDGPILAATSEELVDALAQPVSRPLTLIVEPKIPKKRVPQLPTPRRKIARAAKSAGPKATAKATAKASLKTTRRRGKVYSSRTRTAIPMLPKPERALPDGVAPTQSAATRLERLTEGGLALLRDDGAALAGRIERAHREADARARLRNEETAAEAARVARVRRRIDQVLREVDESRRRAESTRRLQEALAHRERDHRDRERDHRDHDRDHGGHDHADCR